MLRGLVVRVVHEIARGAAREPRDLQCAVRERCPGLIAARREVPEAESEAHGRLGPVWKSGWVHTNSVLVNDAAVPSKQAVRTTTPSSR